MEYLRKYKFTSDTWKIYGKLDTRFFLENIFRKISKNAHITYVKEIYLQMSRTWTFHLNVNEPEKLEITIEINGCVKFI